jgi:hypothetical protein
MEHFVRSLKVFWRSEHLLRQNEFRLVVQKVQYNALAGLVALIGLVMMSIAFFFALIPYCGQALAALAVGCTDFVLAGMLVAYARSLKPSEEVKMAREIRDMALSDIEEEVSQAEAGLVALKDDARRFLRNPVDALLPVAIGPLISAVAQGVRSAKKHSEKTE